MLFENTVVVASTNFETENTANLLVLIKNSLISLTVSVLFDSEVDFIPGMAIASHRKYFAIFVTQAKCDNTM